VQRSVLPLFLLAVIEEPTPVARLKQNTVTISTLKRDDHPLVFLGDVWRMNCSWAARIPASAGCRSEVAFGCLNAKGGLFELTLLSGGGQSDAARKLLRLSSTTASRALQAMPHRLYDPVAEPHTRQAARRSLGAGCAVAINHQSGRAFLHKRLLEAISHGRCSAVCPEPAR
jgi:hypothetical protein